MHARQRHAFTLVELLVVIAVIVLLIAIMLPALGRARESASRARCAANLRGTTQGALIYAAEFSQCLPLEKGGEDPTYNYSPIDTWWATTSGGKFCGFALLYNPTGSAAASSPIRDPRVFFCPSQPDIDFQWIPDSRGSTWLDDSAGGATNENPHMGYQYEVHHNGLSPDKPPYRKINNYPAKHILALDIIERRRSISHVRGNTGFWNSSFVDGHVEIIQSPKPLQLLQGGSEVANEGWPLMDQLIADLEQ